MVEIFNVYMVLFFYLAIGFPLIGGTLLWMGFQYGKIPGFNFVRCWKIYLAGLCYGYLVVWGIGLILQRPAETDPVSQSKIAPEVPESKMAPVMRTVVFYAIPMVAIPLLGRNYSTRAIAIEFIVILLANSIMIFLAYTTLPHVLNTQPGTDRVAPAESTSPRPISKRPSR